MKLLAGLHGYAERAERELQLFDGKVVSTDRTVRAR